MNVISLVLSATAAAASLTLVLRDRTEEPGAVPEQLEDLADDVQSIRLELRGQIDRMEALAQRLAQSATTSGSSSSAAAIDPNTDITKLSPFELMERWRHVAEVLTRYRNDPLQREPVEAERGRIEERLRMAGDDSIAEVERVFDGIPDTWMQTRLLTHLVQPVASPRAYDFAKKVFETPNYLAGVRLFAAQVAMQRDHDEIVGRLIELLEHPDATFDRRDEIVNFLKNNPDPRAVKVLVTIATEPTTELMMRNFAIQALGSYPQPESLDALRILVEQSSLGALRIEALRSLDKRLGKDVLEFAHSVRAKTPLDDTSMRQFLDNLDLKYQTASGSK